MAIDYTTALGQVRLLIPDTVEADPIFTDEQVEAFLAMSGGDVNLATATALRVIASDSLMLYKVSVRSDDGSIGNAAATAEILIKRAETLETGAIDIGFDLVGGETFITNRDWYGTWL